jgi:KDO2-lipid IV(A) lauroyltransferase
LLERPNTPDRKADIENTTAQIQAAFERYIRDAPEQWMWAHRRWG